MKNPFETGQIKNYLLLYASVVVIMILFFIATTLFNEEKEIAKKEFNTTIAPQKEQVTIQEEKPKFKLLDKTY
jgi:hypothetical protein